MYLTMTLLKLIMKITLKGLLNMCKLLLFTNASKITLNNDFLRVAQKHMTIVDKDGFGYAVQDVNGNVYGERTLDATSSFRMKINSTVIDTMPFITKRSNTFGTKVKKAKALMIHSRLSTNTVNLQNTHPFYDQLSNVTLVHNGIVRDSHVKPIAVNTNNDTEILFNYWLADRGLERIEKNVSGYYALGIFDDNRMHVIKDDTASLYTTWCITLDSFIFATTTSIIENLIKDLELECEDIEKVEDNVHMIFNGNELVSYKKINPKGYDHYYGGGYEYGSVYDRDSWDEAVERSLGKKTKVEKVDAERYNQTAYITWADGMATEYDYEGCELFSYEMTESEYKEYLEELKQENDEAYKDKKKGYEGYR